MTRLALALAAVLAAGAAAAPAAGAVQLFVAKGPAVALVPGPGPESVYDVGEDLEVSCGRGGTPLAAGWTVVDGPAYDITPDLDDGELEVSTRRPQRRTSSRALAICARGRGLKATLVANSGERVGCGAKVALGLPASTSWPYYEEAVSATPLGSHGWRLIAPPSGRAEAICVAASALTRVSTVRASASFKAGARDASVSASCGGGRRPVGWGYEAPVMDGNVWSSADTDSKLAVPFVRTALPAGSRGWSLTFRTPDQQGARAAAKVTLLVTCAVPAGS